MTTSLDSIRALLARDHEISPERLTTEVTLDDLGIDSLGMMELLWNLEDELGITLPTDRLPELHTLGEVAAHIDGLVIEQRAAEVENAAEDAADRTKVSTPSATG